MANQLQGLQARHTQINASTVWPEEASAQQKPRPVGCIGGLGSRRDESGSRALLLADLAPAAIATSLIDVVVRPAMADEATRRRRVGADDCTLHLCPLGVLTELGPDALDFSIQGAGIIHAQIGLILQHESRT